MNSYTEKNRSFISDEALEIYRRVKLSSGKVIYADAGEDSIGITMGRCNDDSAVNIKLWNDGGSFPVTAAGAFAIDVILYGAVDGKVDDTVSGDQLGQATEAATADTDVIEMVTIKTLNQGSAAFVDLDLGSSGTAGSLDIFPSTAAKGKFALAANDNAGDTTTSLTNAPHGQATNITFPDSGLPTSYVAQSTAALTVLEVDRLDGATAGTQVADKVVVADTNVNTGVSKITELHVGTSGSEVQVTATPAELNLLDLSEQSEVIGAPGAVSVTKRYSDISLIGVGAVTLAAPDATMIGQVKVIEMITDNGDVTLSLANVQGGTAATTCTWAAVGDALVLVASASKWNVVGEGGVVLS